MNLGLQILLFTCGTSQTICRNPKISVRSSGLYPNSPPRKRGDCDGDVMAMFGKRIPAAVKGGDVPLCLYDNQPIVVSSCDANKTKNDSDSIELATNNNLIKLASLSMHYLLIRHSGCKQVLKTEILCSLLSVISLFLLDHPDLPHRLLALQTA